MNTSANFENDQNRSAFFSYLKEFASVIGFVVALLLLFTYWTGIASSSLRTIYCDAEQVTQHQGEFVYTAKGSYFTGGQEQSTDFAHSGKHSLRLDRAVAFGFEYTHPYTHPYEEFTVSVWRYSNSKDAAKGILVGVTEGMWKGSEGVVERTEDGWEKVSITFMPPVVSHNHPLKIYCWNSGFDPIYFDDLQIEIRQKQEL